MSSEPAPQQLQVYRALSIAAEKIANNLYRLRHKSPYHYSLRHMGATRGGGYSKSFVITDYSHRRLVEAMPKVLSGAITPEDGMAILHEYGIFNLRFLDIDTGS